MRLISELVISSLEWCPELASSQNCSAETDPSMRNDIRSLYFTEAVKLFVVIATCGWLSFIGFIDPGTIYLFIDTSMCRSSIQFKSFNDEILFINIF